MGWCGMWTATEVQETLEYGIQRLLQCTTNVYHVNNICNSMFVIHILPPSCMPLTWYQREGAFPDSVISASFPEFVCHFSSYRNIPMLIWCAWALYQTVSLIFMNAYMLSVSWNLENYSFKMLVLTAELKNMGCKSTVFLSMHWSWTC